MMRLPAPNRRALLPTLVTVLALVLSAGPALAAGGAVPTLVQDIGTSLLVAGGLGVVFARLKIPSIAAFILAGVVIGPEGLHFVTDAHNIDTIAQIGFVLLLFVIGLEINLRDLLSGGKAVLMAGVLQYPLTLLFGFVVAKGVILLGMADLLSEAPLAPLYFGLAIAGSSSLLVVKLFQEHFQLDTQPGRISLTILIFQDIWAIVATLIQPSLESPDLAAIGFSFLGIGVLIVIAALLSRFVISYGLFWIAKLPELVLLAAMSWCFALVAIGTSLDAMTEVFGFNLHMSVGSGMAALIAGATIASSPYSTEIVTKVSLVKDFFVTLFFVGLGMAIPMLDGFEIPLLALLLAGVAMVARQVVVFPLLYFVGVDQRSAEVSSIRLAQISEFGLVITFLGIEYGHVSKEIASVIILAFVFTAILTPVLFTRAYAMHEALRGVLSAVGFGEPKEDEEETQDEIELAILGLHRDASSVLSDLKRTAPELLAKTVVVDFNIALHDRIRQLGARVTYGDISNEEVLTHAGVDRAKVVLCSIPDDLLQGLNCHDLVRMVRHMNENAKILAHANSPAEWRALRAAGADLAYLPRISTSKMLVRAVSLVRDSAEDDITTQLGEAFHPADDRQEVL